MSSCGWAVALPPWRRGRHRQGGVGVTARAVTQECTQIGQNGLSAPFWGVCVHYWAVGLGCGWPWDRNSVHKWEDRASPRRIGAFVYTVGLLRCCGQTWGRNSVHRSPKTASQRRFGAFVYTVATRVAIRIATRAACARWRERLSRHGVPAAPPRWPLSLGREDKLCASGAVARLASSPRRQPTRTPEEP